MGKLIRYSLGLTIILIAVLSTIVSTGLSIMYFSQLTTNETLSMVVVLFIVLLQSMVLFGSISKGTIYKTTPQHYYTLVWFTRICFLISVLSTISFFNQFDKADRTAVIQDLLYMIPFLNLSNNSWLVTNLTNMTLIWLSCIVIDLMSMFFPSVGSDLISGISTKAKIEIQDKSYLRKIFELLTYKPKMLIDKKCIELNIVSTPEKVSTKKYKVSKFKLAQNKVSKLKLAQNEKLAVSKNELAQNKVSKLELANKVSKEKLVVSNQLANEVSKLNQVSTKLASEEFPTVSKVSTKLAPNKNKDISKLATDKVSTKLAKNNKVSTEIVSNEKLANEVSKLATNEVSKKLVVSTNNIDELAEKKKAKFEVSKLANEVSNFIKANYEIEETIKTKELLEKFKLTKNKWYELKKSLDIIETVGTKTKRAI